MVYRDNERERNRPAILTSSAPPPPPPPSFTAVRASGSLEGIMDSNSNSNSNGIFNGKPKILKYEIDDIEYGHSRSFGFGYSIGGVGANWGGITPSSSGSPLSGSTESDPLFGDETASMKSSDIRREESNSGIDNNNKGIQSVSDQAVSHYHFSVIFIGQSLWIFMLFSIYSFQMICPIALFLWSFMTKTNSEFISYFVVPLTSIGQFPFISPSDVLYGEGVVFYLPSLLAMATIFVWLIAISAFNMLFVIALKWTIIGKYKTGVFQR
jgi:hypothetical protein